MCDWDTELYEDAEAIPEMELHSLSILASLVSYLFIFTNWAFAPVLSGMTVYVRFRLFSTRFSRRSYLRLQSVIIGASGSKAGYLPTLDGWRAVAVVGVIAYHDKVHHFGPLSNTPLHHYGFLGVSLFFSISGLLICSRLLNEEQVYGRMDLEAFYMRRVFRILPPALLVLLVIAFLGTSGVIRVDPKAWLAALFFYSNYYNAAIQNTNLSPYTNHFWSLSVEEQFYFVLPFILVFFRRQRIKILAALCLILLIYSLLEQSVPSLYRASGGEYGDIRTEIIIVSLFFPALLAVLLRREPFRAWCERRLTPPPTLLCFGSLWLFLHLFFKVLAVKALVPLGFPFIILSTVLHPANKLSRLLELRPLKFVGKLSYSLYLWQQLFFVGDHTSAVGWFKNLQQWPLCGVATLLCAVGSYYLVERPCIRLGHRLGQTKVPVRAF